MSAPAAALGVAPLAAGFRSGADHPVSALERALAAADRASGDRALRCLVPEARAWAEAARDRHARGAALGPLDGVPIVVKDCIDVQGLVTTNGTRLPFAPAGQSATIVERLVAAGAVIFAKGNMHELGIQPTGVNPHHGTAVNPWAPDLIPGGSSSGAAVSVSSGIAAAAIGTDAGGSIRVPAALNGLVGLKATFGAVPGDGIACLTRDMDHAGPMAWTVDDCTSLYEVVSGQTIDRAAPVGKVAAIAELFEGADEEVTRAVRAAIAESFGPVDEVHAHWTGWASAIQLVTVSDQATQVMREVMRQHIGLLGDDTRAILQLADGLPPSDRRKAARARDAMRAELDALLAKYDVLVGPMTGAVALPLDPIAQRTGQLDTYGISKLASQTWPANLTGLPSCAVPCSREGLPISLQIIGRRYEEARVLAAARQVEARYGPRRPPRWYGGPP